MGGLRIGFRVLLVMLAPGSGAGCLAASAPDRVEVPEMRTSIYVGSIKLRTTAFLRAGEVYSAEYDAKVFPWFFWNESGEISLTVPPADIERLRQGETIEFTGGGVNHRGKPRPVTGRARPENETGGLIKVRIDADGIELIFNGRYEFVDTPLETGTDSVPDA